MKLIKLKNYNENENENGMLLYNNEIVTDCLCIDLCSIVYLFKVLFPGLLT